jgi:hypothetical protein
MWFGPELREEILMAQGKKTPTRIDLTPGDAALVVREDGKCEPFIPDMGDAPVPPSHVMLTGFAVGFEDERLRDVLARIIEERRIPEQPRNGS